MAYCVEEEGAGSIWNCCKEVKGKEEGKKYGKRGNCREQLFLVQVAFLLDEVERSSSTAEPSPL